MTEQFTSLKDDYYAVPRRQVSTGYRSELNLAVIDYDGSLKDPDEGTLHVTVTTPGEVEGEEVVVSSSDITRNDKGLFSYILAASLLKDEGFFDVKWDYEIDGDEHEITDHYQSVRRMPTFMTLKPDEKVLVEQVNWRFADLFDNSLGASPSFFEEFQTSYSYERIAQMVHKGADYVNMARLPATNYGVGGRGRKFPIRYYGVLEKATSVELIKHFIRSYVEQPSIPGSAGIPSVDRRDYLTRWQSVLRDEKEELTKMIASLKVDGLSLGHTSILVSGGIYGQMGSPTGFANSAARSMRFYPQAPMLVRSW